MRLFAWRKFLNTVNILSDLSWLTVYYLILLFVYYVQILMVFNCRLTGEKHQVMKQSKCVTTRKRGISHAKGTKCKCFYNYFKHFSQCHSKNIIFNCVHTTNDKILINVAILSLFIQNCTNFFPL